MSSYLLNNAAALSALQSLNMTQQSLATVQSQVSTGLAVGSAKDNASYWSISQKLQANEGIAGAANTALAQNQAAFDTANSAINSVITTINAIQSALTQANNPGADFATINTTLKSLAARLNDSVNGASFSGTNLLNSNATTNLVSGYDSASGSVTQIGFTSQSLIATGTLTVGKTKIGAVAGAAQTLSPITNSTQIAAFFANIATTAAPAAASVPTPGGTYNNTFSTTGTAVASVVDNQGNMTTTTYTALDAKGVIITAATSASAVSSLSVSRTFTAADNTAAGAIASSSGILVQTGTSANQGSYDLTTLGNTGAFSAVTATNAGDMLSAVNQALGAITNYAASIGATQARMTGATNFNTALAANYADGVAALVDADMNTASTRLQALQTQQQLGIQSLSIANQNANLILKLFP